VNFQYGFLVNEMAYKCREELVGKRFLSVQSSGKLKLNKICEWEWRSGFVRAVSMKDITSPDLAVSFIFTILICIKTPKTINN
jgi:hypothetical protein